MTLLCPLHHREKTAGRLPIPLVEKYARSPHNTGRQFTAGHPLYFLPERPLTLRLGNVTFSDPQAGATHGIAVDNALAFGVGISPAGHPVLEVDIRDLDNRSVLRIIGGQLRTTTGSWDVRFEANRLLVQRNLRDTVIDLSFDAPNSAIYVDSADVALHHSRIHIGARTEHGGIQLPDEGVIISHTDFRGVGISIGASPSLPSALRLDTRRAFGALPAPRGGSFSNW